MHGNLDGGINKIEDLQNIKKLLVEDFPSSKTRKRNFDSFMEFLESLKSGVFTKAWIDGSFCSEKIDPNDIDCILFIDPETTEDEYINEIQANHDSYKDSYLDVFITVDKDKVEITQETIEFYRNADYQEKYWMGQFGFDRNGRPKGIIEINLERRG